MLRPNELMRQKYCFGRLLAVLAAFCLLLSSCGSKPEPVPAPEPELNFFHTLFSTEGGEFAPKVTPFLTSRQGVMDIFLHANSTVFRNETNVIARDIVIGGLTWREIFTFEEDLLMAVSYVAQPETNEEYQETVLRLVKQAETFLPEEMLMTQNVQTIKNGGATWWTETREQQISFSFESMVLFVGSERQFFISLTVGLLPTVELWEKLHPGEPLPFMLRPRSPKAS